MTWWIWKISKTPSFTGQSMQKWKTWLWEESHMAHCSRRAAQGIGSVRFGWQCFSIQALRILCSKNKWGASYWSTCWLTLSSHKWHEFNRHAECNSLGFREAFIHISEDLGGQAVWPWEGSVWSSESEFKTEAWALERWRSQEHVTSEKSCRQSQPRRKDLRAATSNVIRAGLPTLFGVHIST